MPAKLAAPLIGAHENVVRHHVELHLRFALNVGRSGGAEGIGQRTLADDAGYALAGETDIVDQAVKSAGRMVIATLFLDEKPRQGLGRENLRVAHGCTPPFHCLLVGWLAG